MSDNNQTPESTGAPTTTETQTAPAANPASLVDSLAAQAPTSTETDPKADPKADPAKLLAGKYKSVEDLEKAHKELESKMGKGNAPESYEYEPTFKEVGLTWQDDAQRDGVLGKFKEAGLSQKQADAVLKMYAESIKANQATVAQYGPPVDAAKEIAALNTAWGADAPKIATALKQFADTLPADIRQRPLESTAAGMQVLREIMEAKRGPDFIRSVDTNGGGDANAIRAKRLDLMRDPKYGTSTPAGKQLEAEVNKMIEQELRMTGKA